MLLAMTSQHAGYAAGLLTSVLWTCTALVFTAASRRIGVTPVNVTRIAFAIVLLGVTHRLRGGAWWPHVDGRQVALLAASGVVGLAIGDQFLFSSFVYVGPRIAMLLMATAPLMSAILGAVFLNERLSPASLVGITMTVAGVAWVVLERRASENSGHVEHRGRGLFYAFMGALCQAAGYLLSKMGIGHGWLPEAQHLGPQAATFVRMIFAGAGMLPIVILHAVRLRSLRESGRAPKHAGSRAAGVGFALCGAVAGPFLGVWMSLVALNLAPMGIAATLCALPPVFILPFAASIHQEKISARALLGALLAVGGTAILFGVVRI